MRKILIFAGTTEGREIAEFCAQKQIAADVSTATEYGSTLLPGGIGVLSGRMDREEISILLRDKKYSAVIDATHPYAKNATDNIRSACQMLNVPYWRLIRKPLPVIGESVTSLEQMVSVLNQSDDTILSTLGSKSVTELTKIRDFHDRIWLRLLPSEQVLADCLKLGFDSEKLIFEKGPFSTEQNLAHIQKSSAQILLTKESGTIGGYSEKAEAARLAGIRMITLCRPNETESGYYEAEIKKMLLHMRENHLL